MAIIGYIPPAAEPIPAVNAQPVPDKCSARRGSGGTAVPRSDGHGGRRKARQAHKEGGDQGVNP